MPSEAKDWLEEERAGHAGQEGGHVKVHIQISAVLLLALPGCANIQGIPYGLSALTPSQKEDLAKPDLKAVLSSTDALTETYRIARDENLRYVFWSNVAYFPLGAAAARDIYRKNNGALAGVGIVAGTLAAFNSFTNARPNAKVYQTAITALLCIRTKASPYLLLEKDTDDLRQGAKGVAAQVGKVQASLSLLQHLNLESDPVKAELKVNPSLVTMLLNAEKAGSQAISDALHAVTAARHEVMLFDTLPSFVTDSVLQIDSAVAAKITVNDVTYSALVSSLSALTAAPKPATTSPVPAAPTVAKPPTPNKGLLKDVIPPTPAADAIKAVHGDATELQKITDNLIQATAKFALSAREKEMSACLTNMLTVTK